jgi:CopG family nickel-responsive transcriptional regulator
VRDLIRKSLVTGEWQTGNRDVMGVITLVYDHHLPNLLNRITRIQHDSPTSVITTTHVHMDDDNCLEIIIVRGKPGQVQALADRLMALRGVKNGSLTAATTGRHLT